MSPRPQHKLQIRFTQRDLIDENGVRWAALALGTYFVEDAEMMRALLPRIKRAFIRRGLPAALEERALRNAEPQLLAAVPSSRNLGGYGVRVYARGDDIIAVIEELH